MSVELRIKAIMGHINTPINLKRVKQTRLIWDLSKWVKDKLYMSSCGVYEAFYIGCKLIVIKVKKSLSQSDNPQ